MDKARVGRLLQDLPSTQHPTSPSLTAATTVDSTAMDSNRGRGRGKNRQGRGDGDRQNQKQQWKDPPPQMAQAPPPFAFGFGFPGQPPHWAFNGQFHGGYPPPPQQWQGMPPSWFPKQMVQPPPGQQGGDQGVSLSNTGQGSGSSGISGISGQGNQKNQSKQQRKKQDSKVVVSNNVTSLMSYVNVICGGCGEPGHDKEKCSKTTTCFICKMATHQEHSCPVRKKPHLAARYFGSAAPGLGFYHVDMSDVNLQHSGRLKNGGIVFIEDGEISKEDLATKFSEIYKTNWPWQINALDEWTILVKFPPKIPVESVASYPCFGLPKSNVTVKVEAWKGKIEASASQQLIWIKIRKINPRWCEWSILDQITSVFGTLVDVDWQFNFKSFYEVVRVKLNCKDGSKIPKERIYGINGKFYKMLIAVEPITKQRAETGTDNNDTISQGGQETQSKTETSSRTEDNKSNKSTRSGLGRGGGSDPTLGKQAVLAFLQQMPDVCPSEGVEHPSLLKIQIHPSLQASRRSKIDKIVAEYLSDDQCYSILTEMELADLHQDMEEVGDTQEQIVVASVEPLSDTYEADFPLLSKTIADKQQKQKRGPIQATRHNSRVKPSGKTMLEKAQEFKQVKDLETSKTGTNQPAFSLFNNPSFIDVPKKIGVDIDEHSSPAPSQLRSTDPIDTLAG